MRLFPVSALLISALLGVNVACAQQDATGIEEQQPVVEIVSVDNDQPGAIGAPGNVEALAEAPFAEAAFDAIRKNIGIQLPGMPISSISATPINGVYEMIADGQIYYVDATATYLIDGSMIELASRTNLTDARLGSLHIGLINAIDEQDMLIYEPKKPSNRSITVFTDITCGYCRKLHKEIDVLLDEGVRVRYMMFPRAGLGSPAHQNLESVWCAADPQEAMTNAKLGGAITEKSCENPIEAHVALAEQIGLRGTPLIYLDDGQRIPGYREASIIASMVNSSQPVGE